MDDSIEALEQLFDPTTVGLIRYLYELSGQTDNLSTWLNRIVSEYLVSDPRLDGLWSALDSIALR